ncbi:MAG: polysaccharide export protein [Acidobacteriota bacterium]|nr:polysaccharide export protein [Acidobacteriota bacterium]
MAAGHSFAIGQTTTPPPVEQNHETAPPVAAPPASAASAGAAVDSNSYKIQSPDILNIRVWHEQDFSGVYSVHPDGKITLPLVGDIEAGGKSPAAVEKLVRDALTKYVVNPLVTVTVQNVLSKKYYMDGEIGRAGEFELISPTTVFEAISKSGGLGAFANPKKIYVLRGDKRIPFNYKEVIHGKHLEQDILLQPGDHIVVP